MANKEARRAALALEEEREQVGCMERDDLPRLVPGPRDRNSCGELRSSSHWEVEMLAIASMIGRRLAVMLGWRCAVKPVRLEFCSTAVPWLGGLGPTAGGEQLHSFDSSFCAQKTRMEPGLDPAKIVAAPIAQMMLK